MTGGKKMRRKQLSVVEKEKLVLEAAQIGASAVSRKYDISRTDLVRWSNRYKEHGIDGLKRKTPNREPVDIEKQQLLEENRQLKLLLGEKDLELRIKTDLLKKTLLRQGKKE
jgi:transposase-like protein